MPQHDMFIENDDGDVVLADMQLALQALASCNSGPTAPAVTFPGMFWLDTSVPPDGYLRQRNRNDTGWMPVLGMPAQATDADIAAHNPSKFLTPLDIKQMQNSALGYARNRITNPAMQISQENQSAVVSAVNAYHADEWRTQYAGGVASSQRLALVTPRGSPYRSRHIVTTAKSSLAATDYLMVFQPLEGVRVCDFLWGTANARRAVVRFGFRGPAGTYSLGLHNGPSSTRSYIKNFTITAAQANIDTEQIFVIPGDVTGPYNTDNAIGIYFWIGLACGSTYVGASEGNWLSGNFIGTAATSNGMATVGNTFDIFDVGFYLDLDGSGVPPPWQYPDEIQQLSLCQRYYAQAWAMWSGYANAAANMVIGINLPVDMRAIPSGALVYNYGQTAQFGTTSTYAGKSKRCMSVYRLHTATVENVGYFTELFAASARL